MAVGHRFLPGWLSHRRMRVHLPVLQAAIGALLKMSADLFGHPRSECAVVIGLQKRHHLAASNATIDGSRGALIGLPASTHSDIAKSSDRSVNRATQWFKTA